jgi:hypothetical protein
MKQTLAVAGNWLASRETRMDRNTYSEGNDAGDDPSLERKHHVGWRELQACHRWWVQTLLEVTDL